MENVYYALKSGNDVLDVFSFRDKAEEEFNNAPEKDVYVEKITVDIDDYGNEETLDSEVIFGEAPECSECNPDDTDTLIVAIIDEPQDTALSDWEKELGLCCDEEGTCSLCNEAIAMGREDEWVTNEEDPEERDAHRLANKKRRQRGYASNGHPSREPIGFEDDMSDIEFAEALEEAKKKKCRNLVEAKRCDRCGRELNDMGTCPYCDEGEEELNEGLTSFFAIIADVDGDTFYYTDRFVDDYDNGKIDPAKKSDYISSDAERAAIFEDKETAEEYAYDRKVFNALWDPDMSATDTNHIIGVSAETVLESFEKDSLNEDLTPGEEILDYLYPEHEVTIDDYVEDEDGKYRAYIRDYTWKYEPTEEDILGFLRKTSLESVAEEDVAPFRDGDSKVLDAFEDYLEGKYSDKIWDALMDDFKRGRLDRELDWEEIDY